MVKTAVVTGASSGIGKAIALKLAEEKYNVVLAARRLEKLKELEQMINEAGYGGKALAVATDVTVLTDVEAMIAKAEEQFGAIDVLVNNAGVMLDSEVRNGKVEDWDKMIDINIKGVLYGLQAVVPKMIERGEGHIFNTASVAGFEVPKQRTVYSATKFAVRALSIGLEKELARTGVKVTNISPGMVDTELFERGPVDRKILTAEDIASAVIYALKQPSHVNVNEVTIRPV